MRVPGRLAITDSFGSQAFQQNLLSQPKIFLLFAQRGPVRLAKSTAQKGGCACPHALTKSMLNGNDC